MSDPHPAPSSRPKRGRRPVTLHVCVVSSKRHIRRFLAEAFGELGFLARECEDAAAVIASHCAVPADLVVLAESRDEREVATTLHRLAAEGFGASVMLIGDCWSPQVPEAQQLGKQLGLTMLPVLGTPFGAEVLADRVAALRPAAPPPAPPDVGEALGNGWIEPWHAPHTRHRSGSPSICR